MHIMFTGYFTLHTGTPHSAILKAIRILVALIYLVVTMLVKRNKIFRLLRGV